LEAKMSEAQLQTANSMFDGLMATRERDGAYYSASDPLREPSDTKLKAMAEDDPDVQLRRAFALESSGQPEDYAKAMSLYRRVRDRRKVDVRLLLWRESSEGKDGVTKDPEAATFWLKQAAFEGSPAAKLLLAGDTKGAEEERAAGDTLTPPAAPARPSLMVVPGVYHIGGGVTPPKFLHGENPEFSEQARSAKFSGRVEVYLIVDENGNPTHIRVVRGVGMGLDEKAVEAVRTYKFQPAMIDGRPVKVDLYVAVNFQIREK